MSDEVRLWAAEQRITALEETCRELRTQLTQLQERFAAHFGCGRGFHGEIRQPDSPTYMSNETRPRRIRL